MKVLKKLWSWVEKVFNGLNSKTKELVPVAINVVQAIKDFELSGTADFIEFVVAKAIPGNADDKAIIAGRAIIRKWLPKILLELQMIEVAAGTDDINEKLQLILTRLKLSSDETQNIVYHGIASLIIEKLSDGELSWSDSIAISEYYYKNILKK